MRFIVAVLDGPLHRPVRSTRVGPITKDGATVVIQPVVNEGSTIECLADPETPARKYGPYLVNLAQLCFLTG